MDLSDEYENAAYINGAAEFIAGWPRAAAVYRATLGDRFVAGFDPETRRGVDMVLPEGTPQGLVVFVHGGYWRAFSPRDWTHLARGAANAGWAVALPGYPLCPQARIADITRVVAEGLAGVADEVAGPIALTGHSAGGQQVVRMLDVLTDAVMDRITRVAPISMLSDLGPLLQTGLNETLGLDEQEAAAESPLNQSKPAGIDVAIWVGAEERPAFLDQSRWFGEGWGVPVSEVPGRHHFDIVELLEDPASDLVQWLTS